MLERWLGIMIRFLGMGVGNDRRDIYLRIVLRWNFKNVNI